VLSSLLAPRLPAMWGRATFAMLVSSTSMNAASETATAMIQGLLLGCQISSPELAAVAALIGASHRLQRNRAEHRVAVVDFGGWAFKREPVTYRLSEVESFSLMRHNDGYFTARSAAAADVHFCFRICLIAMHDATSQGFAERHFDVAFCGVNTLRSFNQPHQAVYRRRYGVNVARHPGVDFQDARMGAFLENTDSESDAPFRPRMPLMANPPCSGGVHQEGQCAELANATELI